MSTKDKLMMSCPIQRFILPIICQVFTLDILKLQVAIFEQYVTDYKQLYMEICNSIIIIKCLCYAKHFTEISIQAWYEFLVQPATSHAHIFQCPHIYYNFTMTNIDVIIMLLFIGYHYLADLKIMHS